MVSDEAAPLEQHNLAAAHVETTSANRKPRQCVRTVFSRPLPSRYYEAPLLPLPGVPASGGAGHYLDRVGARGELAGSKTQTAGGPAVLIICYLPPVEVHVYVILAQGARAVRHGGLYHGPVATDVSDGAHRGYGYSPRTAAARSSSGAGSRPRVGSVRSPPSSRPAHANSLLYWSRSCSHISIAAYRVPVPHIAGNPGPDSTRPPASRRGFRGTQNLLAHGTTADR